MGEMRTMVLVAAGAAACGSGGVEACNESKVAAYDAWTRFASDLEAAERAAFQRETEREVAELWLRRVEALAQLESGEFINAPARGSGGGGRYGIEGPGERERPSTAIEMFENPPAQLVGAELDEMRRELAAAVSVERGLATTADAQQAWARDGARHIRALSESRSRLAARLDAAPRRPRSEDVRQAAVDARRVAVLARGGAIPMRDAASPVLDRVRSWGVESFAGVEAATSASWDACRSVDP